MKKTRIAVASIVLALVGSFASVNFAEAGYPPFVGNKYCKYHIPGMAPKSCVSKEVYWWWFTGIK